MLRSNREPSDKESVSNAWVLSTAVLQARKDYGAAKQRLYSISPL